MEIEGRIILDLPLQEGVSKAGNNWKKKEWVLETLGNYPRKVKFDFFGDRVDTNRLELGKTYKISFDLESREFNGKWYTDVRAFASLEVPAGGSMAAGEPNAQCAAPAAAPAAAPQTDPFAGAAAQPFQNPIANNDDSDDLPF